jgi:hypothetical protein
VGSGGGGGGVSVGGGTGVGVGVGRTETGAIGEAGNRESVAAVGVKVGKGVRLAGILALSCDSGNPDSNEQPRLDIMNIVPQIDQITDFDSDDKSVILLF